MATSSRGRFPLTRTDLGWILVKGRDEHARPGSNIVAERPESVRSGRTWQQLTNEHTADNKDRARRIRDPWTSPASTMPPSWMAEAQPTADTLAVKERPCAPELPLARLDAAQIAALAALLPVN
ncbi:MAG: hypothetical protein WCD11_12575 [Solirubrobacteraceae bacterium]